MNHVSICLMKFLKNLIYNSPLEIGRFKWWFAIAAFITTTISTTSAVQFAKFFVNIYDKLSGSITVDYSHVSGVSQHILFTAVSIITVAILLWSINRSDFALNLKNKKKIFWSTAIGLGLFTVLVYIFEKINPEGPGASAETFRSLGLGKESVRDIFVVLMVTTFAPIGEEFLFRGVIFRSIRDGLQKLQFIKNIFTKNQFLSKYGTALILLMAVLVSSLMFMDNHGGGGQDAQMIMFFVMGIILAIAFQYSGSLYVPILIHSLNNTIAIFNMARKASDFNFAFPYMYGLIIISPFLAFVITYLIQNILPKKAI